MKIVLKGKDGSVAIMTLAEGADKEEAIRKFKDVHPEGFYIDHLEFDGEMPENRDFRDAWTMVGNKIIVHENKAKEIHLDRVRKARDLELERLDKEQLRWMTDPWKPKEIEEKKQILRDLPSTVTSLDWPEGLPKGN